MATTNGSDPVAESTRQQRALTWAAVAAVVAILWLVRPIGLGLLLGVLLAFIAQPMYERLRARVGVRWAAATTVLLSGLSIGLFTGLLGWLFVSRGAVLSAKLAGATSHDVLNRLLERTSGLLARLGISPQTVSQHAEELATRAAGGAARAVEAIASATAGAILGLFFAMLAMHYVLRQGEALAQRVADMLPLRPEYTVQLFREFKSIGRATLLGSVVTALAQGGLAAIGFAITGVPEPLFFGALTAIASFIPAVGVLVVLVPVVMALAFLGHWTAAVVQVVWGLVFVIGVPDYVLRPRLVRSESQVPSLATFAALFGGVQVLGLPGLLVGPVVMAVALAVLRLYSSEHPGHVDPTPITQ
jgi:predicted PurR-regulated permease PerM